jgi:hypothetical protein
VVVPLAWYEYGLDFDRHTSSTVGGPLTVGLCILLGILSDVLLWVVVLIVWLVNVFRRNAKALRLADDSANQT